MLSLYCECLFVFKLYFLIWKVLSSFKILNKLKNNQNQLANWQTQKNPAHHKNNVQGLDRISALFKARLSVAIYICQQLLLFFA